MQLIIEKPQNAPHQNSQKPYWNENASGYKGVEEHIQSVESTKKNGIIAGVGDRRDEYIKECDIVQKYLDKKNEQGLV